MSTLLGIYREPECSPGRHLSNDSLLIEQIARELSARGASVRLLHAEEALAERPDVDLVFSMCQGPAALEGLLDWSRRGARIVNDPAAALNTYRDHLPTLLANAAVPYPATRLLDTAAALDADLVMDRPMWLKRGDLHASVSSDVQRVETAAQLRAGLADFVARGVDHVALQEHRPGTEIKFYGVAGRTFFHWFVTNDAGSPAPATPALQDLAERAAAAAGLGIFGGDVIVGPTGDLTLIDLNDWPSFAPCREAASEAIADFLMRRVDAAWNRGLVSSAHEGAL